MPAVASAPAAAPAAKMTVSQFVRTLQGTEHEVWSRLLQLRHRFDVMAVEDWHKLLQKIGAEPAHPHDPRWL